MHLRACSAVGVRRTAGRQWNVTKQAIDWYLAAVGLTAFDALAFLNDLICGAHILNNGSYLHLMQIFGSGAPLACRRGLPVNMRCTRHNLCLTFSSAGQMQHGICTASHPERPCMRKKTLCKWIHKRGWLCGKAFPFYLPTAADLPRRPPCISPCWS